MDTLPTYKEQYDKVINAYFKDELKPLDPQFCFCGTLCSKDKSWYGVMLKRHNDYKGYTGDDFVRMEKALIETIRITRDELPNAGGISGVMKLYPEKYEQALFDGMVVALDELKRIHQEHGEIIDDTPTFQKRIIQNKKQLA